MGTRRQFGAWILGGTVLPKLAPDAFARDDTAPVHGLWIWKTASVLEMPRGAAALRDFCGSQGVHEVYASFSGERDDLRVAGLIATLHRSCIRVEALLSSVQAYQPGKHRDKLLDEVRGVAQFNQKHQGDRFDGIHLDIEPQQLAENKGAGNLRFLPALVETYAAVRAMAEPAGMTVNADIPVKFLKGSLDERILLLSALPRFTLMLYELSGGGGRETAEGKAEPLRKAAQSILDTAYQGLGSRTVARMSIGLRTPDYGELLPEMLRSLDETLAGDPHYLGWAWHSYNDYVTAHPDTIRISSPEP